MDMDIFMSNMLDIWLNRYQQSLQSVAAESLLCLAGLLFEVPTPWNIEIEYQNRRKDIIEYQIFCLLAIWSSNSLKYWDWISKQNIRCSLSYNSLKYSDLIKYENNYWALIRIPDSFEYLWIFTKAVHIGRWDRLDQAVFLLW